MHVIDKEIKSNLNDKVIIVCKKINHIRKDKGLQQKTVATYIGFDQSSYNKVENGKWKPSVEILKKLSIIFDIIVDELLNSYKSHFYLHLLAALPDLFFLILFYLQQLKKLDVFYYQN